MQHNAVDVSVFFRVDTVEIFRCTLDCRPEAVEMPVRMGKYGQDFEEHQAGRDEPAVAVDLLAANANARIRFPVIFWFILS